MDLGLREAPGFASNPRGETAFELCAAPGRIGSALSADVWNQLSHEIRADVVSLRKFLVGPPGHKGFSDLAKQQLGLGTGHRTSLRTAWKVLGNLCRCHLMLS